MLKTAISPNVIKRLPRYYRYLGQLLEEGTMRISSGELAKRLELTASQIRQDLNCFGGFGQQGFGYNVKELHRSIAEILGLSNIKKAILVGVGNLGRAICSHVSFEKYGFRLIGIFDKNEAVSGTIINGIPVRNISVLEEFCREQKPDIAIVCVPKAEAYKTTDELIDAGITAFWNFANYDIALNNPNVMVENVHLSDSLMTLRYRLKEKE